jgi:hypothetical protein
MPYPNNFEIKNADIIFAITVEDLQYEAKEKIGRKLTDEEIEIAKKGLEYGIGDIALDITYNTIFTEMIKK